MNPATPDQARDVFKRFVNGQLAHDEWTHEAHLVTCWVALQDRSPARALSFLRDAIQTHNCGLGIDNTDTSGYHETLTVYFVTAVHQVQAATPEALFDHPQCNRVAAGIWWSKELLFSPEARKSWVAPDLRPLPWPVDSTLSSL